MYKETEILHALAINVTMNDKQISELLLTYDNPIHAYETLMFLTSYGVVIMSTSFDAGNKIIGGIYSLPSVQRAKYL